MMQGGTHAQIASVLDDDPMVKSALADLAASPGDAHARAALIDVLTRTTGNCVGQAAIQEVKHVKPDALTLKPEDHTVSIYKVLPPDTAKAISVTINGKADAQMVLASGDAPTIVRQISRMAGRCIGQAILAAGLSPF